MNKFIVMLTFIPWFLYFSSLCKSGISDLKNNKFSFLWLKENFFKVFRFDNFILFVIFFYFSTSYYEANQIWLAEVLLFTSINFYLYISRYYDKNKTELNYTNQDISLILIILLITLIPFFIYIYFGNQTITYYILFTYNFFNYFIVYISKAINRIVIKKFVRKNAIK